MFNAVRASRSGSHRYQSRRKTEAGWLRMVPLPISTFLGLDSGARQWQANHCVSKNEGENQMRTSARTLLRVCLLVSVPIAAMAQAAGGRRSGNRNTRRQPNYRHRRRRGVNVHHRRTGEFGRHLRRRTASATYQVTFPAAGSYALYMRIYVGPDRRQRRQLLYSERASTTPPNWAGSLQHEHGGATARIPAPACRRRGSAGQQRLEVGSPDVDPGNR